MRPLVTASVLLCLAAAGAAFARSVSPEGPIPSMTGAFAVAGIEAEPDCSLCHYAPGANGGAIATIEILDLPATYLPGASYPIRVRVSSEATASFPNRAWGFQLTAVRASDGAGAGDFVPVADTTRVESGQAGGPWASRRYVMHALAGRRIGIGGFAEWSVTWQAPPTAVGPVHFFAAGNAANGDHDGGGDYIATTSGLVGPDPTPVVRATLGGLRARYLPARSSASR